MSESLVTAYMAHNEAFWSLEDVQMLVQAQEGETWVASGIALAGHQTENGLNVDVLSGTVESTADTQVFKVDVIHDLNGVEFKLPYIVSYRKVENEAAGSEYPGEAGDESGSTSGDAEVDLGVGEVE